MKLKKGINTKIYTKKGDNQCYDAILELENYGILYIEQRLDIVGITREEVDFLARHTENGIMDLLSRQSKEFKRVKNSRILDMSYNQLVDFIVENPRILAVPIVYSKKRVIAGYSQEEMENFAAIISGKRKKAKVDD